MALGSAVLMGALAAVLWGLAGLPALYSAVRSDELLPVTDTVALI
jgi:hypothetical protein